MSVHESLKIPRNDKGYKYGTQDVLALLIAMKYFLQGDRYRKLIKHIDYALNIKLAKRLHSISVDDIKSIMGLTGNWTDLPKISKEIIKK